MPVGWRNERSLEAGAGTSPDAIPECLSERHLAHAIAAAADARARRAALEQAAQAANTAVLAAIRAAEAAEAALAEAGPLAVKHTVDKAVGTAGPPPMSVAQARAAVIQARTTLTSAGPPGRR